MKDRSIENSKKPSLLAGKIFDDKGNYMSPYHSNSRKGKRYRYYLSQAVIRQGVITKISAGEIEDVIIKTIKTDLCAQQEYIQKMFKDWPVNIQKEMISVANEVDLSPQEVRDIISKIKILKETVEINYSPAQLKETLMAHYEGRKPRNIPGKIQVQ